MLSHRSRSADADQGPSTIYQPEDRRTGLEEETGNKSRRRASEQRPSCSLGEQVVPLTPPDSTKRLASEQRPSFSLGEQVVFLTPSGMAPSCSTAGVLPPEPSDALNPRLHDDARSLKTKNEPPIRPMADLDPHRALPLDALHQATPAPDSTIPAEQNSSRLRHPLPVLPGAGQDTGLSAAEVRSDTEPSTAGTRTMPEIDTLPTAVFFSSSFSRALRTRWHTGFQCRSSFSYC